LSGLGITPRLPDIPLKVAEVVDGSPAQAAGMQAGDEVLAVNNTDVADWSGWVTSIRESAGQSITITVLRNGQSVDLQATPKAVTLDSGEVVGQIGVMAQAPEYPADWLRQSEPGVIRAFQIGIEKTGQLIWFTLDSLGKMITGDVSVKNLSGPITIAKVAGASASGGLEAFVSFLALLSVSLGVLNLLPVPMLDGGHIVFYMAELIRGKPLPESVQIAAVKIGMVLLLMLMIVAFYNDISRL
jgi:regulator of sigma E protease